MKVMLALIILAGATAAILNLSQLAKRSPFTVSRLEYINVQLKYQALLMGIALLVLLILYFVNQANLRTFLAPGDIAAAANGVPWMGISEGESWRSVGASLSIFITLATSTFVYSQFRSSAGDFRHLLAFVPWVLLFALTNSFSEEVVYRLGAVVPLAGSIDTGHILLISAVAFGAPHLRGMPNGIVGALMAGFLGWLLTKAVVETNGILWAWFIHLLQDVVIFSFLVMAAANKSLQPTAIARSTGAGRG